MKKLLIAFLVLMLSPAITHATHIVGGLLYYDCTGMNPDGTINLEVTCKLFRDTKTNGADCDFDPLFGLYRQTSAGDWVFVDDFQTFLIGDPTEVIPNDNPCLNEPVDQVGVEQCNYRFEINNLEVVSSSYMISYQRCCRNNTIFNIDDPGETGIALTVEITPEAQALCNSNPTFNAFPPIFICSGFDLDIDQSATDPDGDSLVYRFCSPLASGGTDGSTTPGSPNSCTGVQPAPANCPPPYDPVVFLAPDYASQFPIGGDPLVKIGLTDGIITGVPNALGQFTVGVCVEEYRDGVKIGEVRQDFQFNVLVCEPTVFADIQSAAEVSNQEFFIQSCGENTVNIENNSTQQAFITSYEWVFDINGTMDTFDTRDVSVTFPGIGEYTGTMILNKGTDCADTAEITVGVFPAIEGDFSFMYDTCVAGPVDFTDLTVTGADNLISWEWDFGEDDSSVQNPSHIYSSPGNQLAKLVVTDSNECKDTVTQIVEYYPAPSTVIVEPNAFVGCAPADIVFTNLTMPIDESYDITWSFGDGETSNVISPSHVFDNPGKYTINIEIISPLNCEVAATFTDWITIKEGPIADFTFEPEELNSLNKTVDFTDMSIDGVSWQWSFGNEGFSQLQNPTYEFQDTGTHRVQLVTFHESGCTDTLVRFIDVMPLTRFFFPNAFTPNFDGTNETFKGKGVVDGMNEFSLNIWNRWGELVFQTLDPNEGWDGRKNNDGQLSPSGVYVYTYSFKGARNQLIEGKGKVTLLR